MPTVSLSYLKRLIFMPGTAVGLFLIDFVARPFAKIFESRKEHEGLAGDHCNKAVFKGKFQATFDKGRKEVALCGRVFFFKEGFVDGIIVSAVQIRRIGCNNVIPFS